MHFWVKRFGLPVLYFDPKPDWGTYWNKRMIFGLMPRPVYWLPSNWFILSITTVVSAFKQAAK